LAKDFIGLSLKYAIIFLVAIDNPAGGGLLDADNPPRLSS